MKKKEYMRPAMQANSIAAERVVCQSPVNKINSGGLFNYAGGGNVSARAQERSGEEELDDLSDTNLW